MPLRVIQDSNSVRHSTHLGYQKHSSQSMSNFASEPDSASMLPTSQILLTLPSLVLHPPTHPNHVLSLYTALLALRKCLALHAASDQNRNAQGDALSSEMECQAWTLLAEVGVSILGAGFGEEEGPSWARGIENEVESAISKGLHISLKQPSLRAFRPHLTLLHSHLALWQHNAKFSRALLKRLFNSLTILDPLQVHYTVLLTQHAGFLSAIVSPASAAASTSTTSTTYSDASLFPPPPSPAPSATDFQAALQTLSILRSLAEQNEHADVVRLANVMKLRTLVRADRWHAQLGPGGGGQSVAGCLIEVERVLGLDFSEQVASTTQSTIPDIPPSPFTVNLQTHALIIAVLYYTIIGSSAQSSARLKKLHEILDANSAEENELGMDDGYFSIPLDPGPPLIIKTTHPRVIYELAFAISAVSRRDAVGRNPRRKVFAVEGLRVADTEEEIPFPVWAGLRDSREVEDRLAKIKADLLCEVVAVCIMRSEFEEAESRLFELIAHTRSYSLFPYFASRITLHQAHLAHATDQSERALKCYRAAAYLDETDGGGGGGFVKVAARAGEAGLRIGLNAGRGGSRDVHGQRALDVANVVKECRAFKGTLESVGRLLEATLSDEIVRAKQHLKASLDIASASQDNYLRALILALTSSRYLHTASEHAKKMLETCRQLAAGLGAQTVDGSQLEDGTSRPPGTGESLGNAPLGLWIGEQFLELNERQGRHDKARKQAQANEVLRGAVRALPTRVNGCQPKFKQGNHPVPAMLGP